MAKIVMRASKKKSRSRTTEKKFVVKTEAPEKKTGNRSQSVGDLMGSFYFGSSQSRFSAEIFVGDFVQFGLQGWIN